MNYEREIHNITAEETGFIVTPCGWLYFPSPCLHLDRVLSDEVISANGDKFKIRGIVRAYCRGAFLVLLLRIRIVTFK